VAVRTVVCVQCERQFNVLGNRVWQCVRQCAAVRQCSSVWPCASVRMAVCCSVHGSVQQCASVYGM
jgi:hypothetical protein